MKKFTSKSSLVFILTSGTMALLMQDCGGPAACAQAATAPDLLGGFWQSRVGTASADHHQPSQARGPARGTWMRLVSSTTRPGHGSASSRPGQWRASV